MKVALVVFAALAVGAFGSFRLPTSTGGCDGPWLRTQLRRTNQKTLEDRFSAVQGVVWLVPERVNGVCRTRAIGRISNLGPGTTPHGIHIHEFGDISARDGSATGGHLNPDGAVHGLPFQSKFKKIHLGDLGNLFPTSRGVAILESFTRATTRQLCGKGMIVHAALDDGGQPTGNAGARLAQGLVKCVRNCNYAECQAIRDLGGRS